MQLCKDVWWSSHGLMFVAADNKNIFVCAILCHLRLLAQLGSYNLSRSFGFAA